MFATCHSVTYQIIYPTSLQKMLLTCDMYHTQCVNLILAMTVFPYSVQVKIYVNLKNTTPRCFVTRPALS